MNPVDLADELVRLRRTAGLTQAQLASRMGTTQTAVSRLESGRLVPTLDVLDRFARATGQEIRIVLGAGAPTITKQQLRRRVRDALGDYEFDPWARRPGRAEADSLRADGLTRERFQSDRPARSRKSRA